MSYSTMRSGLERPAHGWMLTASGKRFWPLDPRPEDVDVGDIAHALSNLCRFGGHTREFYSVAQHSVLVAQLVPSRLAMHALLHDAAEAYVGDMVRPLKRTIGDKFSRVEDRVLAAILAHCGLEPLTEFADLEEVKRADDVALVTERRDLMADSSAWPWRQDEQAIVPDVVKILPLEPSRALRYFLTAWDVFIGSWRANPGPRP